jgi:hypothetical protein
MFFDECRHALQLTFFDEVENTGKQFVGALHINLRLDKVAGPRFAAVMRQVPDTFRDLASADLLVFYCVAGATRSPNTMTSYLYTRDNAVERTGFNANQVVVLLKGGMGAYQMLDSPTLSK